MQQCIIPDKAILVCQFVVRVVTFLATIIVQLNYERCRLNLKSTWLTNLRRSQHYQDKVPYCCKCMRSVCISVCRSKEVKMERVKKLFAIKLNGHSAVSIQLELHQPIHHLDCIAVLPSNTHLNLGLYHPHYTLKCIRCYLLSAPQGNAKPQ